MNMHYPAVLWLMPLALLAVAATLRSPANRSLAPMFLASLRAGALAAAICALASPFVAETHPADRLPLLVDISSSVGARQGAALLDRARRLASELGVSARLIPFAKEPGVADSAAGHADFAELRRTFERLDTGATNISAALAEAALTRPPVALLLSDGYETAGSAALGGGATKIFPLTEPGESPESALTISQLHAPLTVKAKKSAELRTTISNGSAAPRRGELEVKHGNAVVLKRDVEVLPGRDLLVVAQSDPNAEGLNTITATLSWSEPDGQHSISRTAWLSSERRSRVLLLSGTADDARFLPQILRSQSYELESSVSGSGPAPSSPAPYRTIVLNNVPADALPEAFLRALPEHVRQGGSLIMVGGNRSFGLGRYIGSPIEGILPVELVPPHTEKKRLNVAVQLVIDKSRSMAQDARLEFAKAAAREVVASLKDDDYLGVIGFEEVAFVALPISRVGDVRFTASDRISRLFPTNRTNLYPALEEGRRGLSRVNAGRKHLIVLTDGQIPDQGPIYFELIRQLRLLGITVSTVLVGSDAPDAFLVEMAQMGGGSFYHTNDPRNLPRIFLSDIKVATGERTLKEDPRVPVLIGPDGLHTTHVQDYPELHGFVETLARPGALTELVVPEEDRRFPLLASWKVGQGRSIAFTSDANGRWSAPWVRWNGMEEFWSDLIESAQPASKGDSPSATQFDLRTWVEGADLVMDLAIFDEHAAGGVTASIKTPQGSSATVAFVPETKGHFRAKLSGATAGTYRATIAVGAAELPEVAWTLSGELFGEQAHRAPNLPLLEALASRSGGRVNPQAADIRPFMAQVANEQELSHAFLIAAMLLFGFELLARELLRARLRPRR